MGKGKYLTLWEQKLPIILSAIEEGGSKKQLSPEEFEQQGNRVASGYTFRLDISNGIIPIKKGSAVARDLKEVLDNSIRFKNIAKDKHITIKMGNKFILIIEIH